MTEHQIMTLGYRYERANGERAKALLYSFTMILNELHSDAREQNEFHSNVREQYIYLFNKGIEEARSRPKRV